MSKVLSLAAVLLVLTACNRPSEESCREAIANIQRITGTEEVQAGADVEAAVRACQGQGTKKSVECMSEARNLADLQACEGGVAERMFGKDPSELTGKAEGKSNAGTDEAVPDEAATEKAATEKAVPDEAATENAGTDEAGTETATPETATPETESPTPAEP